jgi:glutathione S-transferase
VPRPPQIPELVERGRRRAEHFFDRVERQLAHGAHLAGGGFSYADISLLVTVDFTGWVDIVPQATRPALARWHERVAGRESAKA